MRESIWARQLEAPATSRCARTDCATVCGSSYATRHPGAAAAALHGIQHGVDIGFTGNRLTSRSSRNLRSAFESSRIEQMVRDVIEADVAAGKKAGPFDDLPFEHFSFSPIGAVPKAGSWEKIRVIHHLSHPFGGDSINANITDDEIHLGSFDQACEAIRTLGAGCFLIKLDVEAAYKQVPVRREDRSLLGLTWDGKYYYELTLPFGLKSSGARWELYAAALHWFFEHHVGVRLVIHYVDDFLFVVATEAEGRDKLADTLALCQRLGVPMATKKTEGPTTRLTFLGIELDTAALTARLSDVRLAEIQQLLHSWHGRTTCSIKDLQTLAGKLYFACHVVRPGRAYLRRIIEQIRTLSALQTDRSGQHAVSRELRADVAWWRKFMAQWNGHSIIHESLWQNSEKMRLWTDACGTGYGGHYGNAWFQGRWTKAQLRAAWRVTHISMPFLELHALVYAAAAWGDRWRGKRVLFLCDAQPVVHAIASLSSKDSDMQALLRHLSTTAGLCGFEFRAQHVAGLTNTVSDCLSRGCSYQELLQVLPGADAEPTPLPELPRLRDM